MIYDYIIIGAGVSGLYTNYCLKKKNPNLKILILESSDRIGGRIYKKNKSNLGAKFLHDDIKNFLKKSDFQNITFYLGKLINKSENIKNSMKLEDSGSINKNIHNKFNFCNEINVEFDFNKLIKLFNKKLNIKLNTYYYNYSIKNNIIIINNKFYTKKLIFALSVNVLKIINNPFQQYFKNWTQANIITFSFELNNHNKLLINGFFFDEEFKRTSFYFDQKKNILYVNIFDRNKNFSINNYKNKIIYKYLFNISFKFYYINWTNNEHFLGAWSIPLKSLNKNIINIIQKGFEDKIFYVGDYLNNIEEMGSVTNCLRSVENLLKNSNLY